MNCEDIEIEDLEGEQLDVAEAIGIDAYRELITIFPGSFIYIAKPETVLREKRNKRILEEYLNGTSVRALAARYQLSESTIRVIMNEERRKEHNNDPGSKHRSNPGDPDCTGRSVRRSAARRRAST